MIILGLNAYHGDAAAYDRNGMALDVPQLSAARSVKLACPVDRSELSDDTGYLRCARGHSYPVASGIPVLLDAERLPAIAEAAWSWSRATGEFPGDPRAPELYLESLRMSQHEKGRVAELWQRGPASVDAAVQMLIGVTCGIAYRGALGALKDYPIPRPPLANGNGRVLVDIGCNWGRWSIAAARLDYSVIGCDPQLGALVAAQRVARQLGVDARYLCADARFLPLPDASADVVLSYSVLQHLSPEDAASAIREIGRILKPGGFALVQMANVLGIRSLYHLARRRFRAGQDFDVRYYLPGALRNLFRTRVGPVEITPDCYLGLGLQATDRELMKPAGKAALAISESLKGVARHLPPLRLLADSLWIKATKLEQAT